MLPHATAAILAVLWGVAAPAAPAPAAAPAAAAAPVAAEAPLFRVVSGGRWGYIDATGKVAIAPRFDAAEPFSDGLASVRLEGKLGYVDRTGALVLVPELDPAGVLHRPFKDGRAAVRKGGRIGFIDRTGKLVVPARWLTAEDFSEGFAAVCSEEGCGFVDPGGAYRGSPMWMGVSSFRSGYATVALAMAMSHQRTILVGRDGALVPGEFDGNGPFAEGLAPARVRAGWGYVDAAGNAVIPARFSDAGPFAEGLAPVTPIGSDLCGYVDRAGKLVIAARFLACGPFSAGRARVDLAARPEDGEQVAFVDRTGAVVIRGATAKPPFLGAGDFSRGLAAVSEGGVMAAVEDGGAKLGYVDPAGRYVWTPTR